MADKICSLFVQNKQNKTIALANSVLGPQSGGLVHFYTADQVRNILRMEEENQVDIQTDVPEEVMKKVEELREKKEQSQEPGAAFTTQATKKYPQFNPSDIGRETIDGDTRGPNLFRDKRADTMHVDEDKSLSLDDRKIKTAYNDTVTGAPMDAETIPLDVRSANMKIPNWQFTGEEGVAAQAGEDALENDESNAFENAMDSEDSAENTVQSARKINVEEQSEDSQTQTVQDIVGETPYEQDPTKEDVEEAGTVSEDTKAEEKREEEQEEDRQDSQSQNNPDQETSESDNEEGQTSESKEEVENSTKTAISSESKQSEDSKEEETDNDNQEVVAFGQNSKQVKVTQEEAKPNWYLSYQEVEDMTKQELLDWSEQVDELKLAKSKTASETKEQVHEFLSEKFEDHAE